ncbi:MAG: recombination helicase AddA, partial [Clostridia bacterium]|nr:recombination helicase AddA [Clostridia bacterium]
SYKDNFDKLLFIFGGEQDSKKLSSAINQLYEYLQSIPFNELWMNFQLEKYKDKDIWIKSACNILIKELEEYILIYDEIIDQAPFKAKDMDILLAERLFMTDLKKLLYENKWDSVVKNVKEYEFVRSPACAKDNLYMQKYKEFRSRLKENYLLKDIFLIDSAALNDDLSALYDGIKSLFSLVKEYKKRIYNEFIERNRFSFDAVSQMALSLLIENYDLKTGEFTRTTLSEALFNSFDEILIDEYQDVNDLQDMFFQTIACNNFFAVGDVKQSIYGFRRANPENFLRKKDTFKVIDLNKNFRSRKGVLDYINFLFKQLFSKNIGGLDYDQTEMLYNGMEYPPSELDVELHLISADQDEAEEEAPDKSILQAKLTAKRIKELLTNNYQVFDRDINGMRPVRLNDIAVLLKTFAGIAPVYESVFMQEGIPVLSKSGGSFMDSIEVNIILALLNIIDNPYNDIALFAVMQSPIYNFSMEELADIRLINKKKSFFSVVKEAYNQNSKYKKFIDEIEHFRILSQNIPIHKLIWEIYNKTSYPAIVACYPMGDVKKENLMKLYAFARRYSDNLSGGFYKFIKFAEKTREQGGGGEDSAVTEGNYVKLLTIHASKGLEFPICIIPEINKKLNIDDIKKPLLIDDELGVGTVIRDKDMVFETTTMMKELIGMKIKRRVISESLRLLYVAMTRAKERLILISAGKKYDEKNFMSRALYINNKSEKLYENIVLKCDCFEDFILNATVNHPFATQLHTPFSQVINTEEKIEVYLYDDINDETYKLEEKEITANITAEELKRRFTFKYDDALSKIPAKISVTELSKGIEVDDDSEILIKPEIKTRKPRFLEGESLTSAEKGTAIHAYCQYADLTLDIEVELKRLVKQHFITEKQAEAVDKEKIKHLKDSIIVNIMKSAEAIRKEEHFISQIPVSFYGKNNNFKDKTMLLQGAIDLLCEFSEGFIIVDYKTDKADEKTLLSRYGLQLAFYKKAVEDLYKKPVNKVLIWSFHLSKAIECEQFLPQLN